MSPEAAAARAAAVGAGQVVRVSLPGHLARLAGLGERRLEVAVTVSDAAVRGSPAHLPPPAIVTVAAVLRALERAYPMLEATFTERQPGGAPRLRPYLKVFAAGGDLTPGGLQAPLPAPVLSGAEPLRVVGAIAGG